MYKKFLKNLLQNSLQNLKYGLNKNGICAIFWSIVFK